MKKFILLTGFALIFSLQIGLAQYDGAKDGIGLRAVFPNYQWPMTDDLNKDDFTAGLEVEYLRHLNNALNLGVPFRIYRASLPTDDKGGFLTSGNVDLDLTLQLKYFKESNFIYPYLYAGLGATYEDLSDMAFSAPLGLALNFRLTKHTYLSAKGEYRLGFDDLRDNLRLAGGLLVLLGPGYDTPVLPAVSDSDGDGVMDAEDLCPDEAGIAGLNGCPDRDGDGVADGEDQCPDLAGLPATMGCPDGDGDGIADKDDDCPTEPGPGTYNGCPFQDADGDGIADENDDCPGQPGTAATRGCPDGDGDGVADRDDDCPTEMGAASSRGCPDTDGDGVANKDDKCPNTPGLAANNGCPQIEQQDQETLDLAMKAVEFETGEARLKSSSFAILDRIVEIMTRYPDYRLAIGGHTDSIGSSATNQALSEKRAKAAYDYLISKGISARRLSYAGYGESQPIADNRYKDGREKNRRVEFNLYIQ